MQLLICLVSAFFELLDSIHITSQSTLNAILLNDLSTICNPVTGEVNKTVFENWKNYDISLYLRSNWNKLKNDLDSKIRVSVGEQDNFLLNSAVHLLESEKWKS